MDSGYTPTGAILEMCYGNADIAFSYYELPSVNFTMSQNVVKTNNTYGQVKAVLNCSQNKQNFFATVNTTANASFILHHVYVDSRP